MLFDRSDPAVFWLNVTNAALGIVVGLCFLAVLYGITRDILSRARSRAAAAMDHHTFVSPELGVTMADGGEPVDSPKK